MSRKILYMNEMSSAYIFLQEHKNDKKLMDYLDKKMNTPILNKIGFYNEVATWLRQNYPEITKPIIMGLLFMLEE